MRAAVVLCWLAVVAASCHRQAPTSSAPRSAPYAPDAGVGRDAGPPVVPTTVIEMKAEVAVSLPLDAVCPHARGKANTALPGACRHDPDCTEHPYGRCTSTSADRNVCVYDECVADSECEQRKAGTICFCNSGTGSAHNHCQRGNCRSDADCAPGAKCAREHALSGTTALEGSFCTTTRDGCQPWNDGGCGQSACTYSGAERRWLCTPGTLRGLTD